MVTVAAAFRNIDKDLEVSQMFTFEPLGVALPADDPHLIDWVQNFFMTIQRNGTLSKLTKYWFADPSSMKELP
jgi:ABC-type amino acid transport substrate-binding protein